LQFLTDTALPDDRKPVFGAAKWLERKFAAPIDKPVVRDIIRDPRRGDGFESEVESEAAGRDYECKREERMQAFRRKRELSCVFFDK
jgi:hypothetical protein